jgi:serine protease Do
LITKVSPSGPAAWAGLKKGTLVLKINHSPVTTVQEFNQALETMKAGQPLLLLIKQGELTRYITIRIG